MMNVYAARLAKVSDRLDALSPAGVDEQPLSGPAHQEITRLRHRLAVLDWAVVLGTVGAASTCMAILTLFLIALFSNTAIAGVLVAFFGTAIVCTLVSVATFGLEMLISSRSMRSRMLLHWPQLLKGQRTRL